MFTLQQGMFQTLTSLFCLTMTKHIRFFLLSFMIIDLIVHFLDLDFPQGCWVHIIYMLQLQGGDVVFSTGIRPVSPLGYVVYVPFYIVFLFAIYECVI